MTEHDLDQKLIELRVAEIEARSKLIPCLEEIYRRKLWQKLGFDSMTDLCMNDLGYSQLETKEVLIAIGAILPQEKMIVDDPAVQPKIEILKGWRKKKAIILAVAPFRILPNRTLMAVAKLNPRSLGELREVPGIGDKKIEDFGEEILNCLNAQ